MKSDKESSAKLQKLPECPALWAGMNGSAVFVQHKGALPLCNPKGKDPSGSLRDNVPQREVKPRSLGGELH